MHTSLVWHRDAASYLDGYEGRSSYVLICIFLFNVGHDGDMLLPTYIVAYGDMHCDVAYVSLIYNMCAFYIYWLYSMGIWILVDTIAMKVI